MPPISAPSIPGWRRTTSLPSHLSAAAVTRAAPRARVPSCSPPTLDYVDTDHIFLFGESYGGVVSSLAAITHNEIPGIILLSTGISDTMLAREEDDPTYLANYDYDNPLEAIKDYHGDVICFNGQQDFAHDDGEKQISVYNQREEGTAVFYSLENSDHSFSALSDEGKEFLITTMRDFVLDRS